VSALETVAQTTAYFATLRQPARAADPDTVRLLENAKSAVSVIAKSAKTTSPAKSAKMGTSY
jgi:hypothetical protein